jgi:hypothetical protein
MKDRRTGLAVLGALVLGLVVPGTAFAAPPPKIVEQFHDHFTDVVDPNNICGVDGSSQIVVTDNFTVYEDDSFADKVSYRETFTADDGRSVVISNAGLVRGADAVIDEEAGTISFTTTFIGLPEKIRSARGAVQTRDAGRITIVDTFDLETGDFLGSEITQNGPHPEADADFELFCDAFLAALG